VNVTFNFNLISPFISQRELEGLNLWVHSLLGPSLSVQVHPYFDQGEPVALRSTFQFVILESDARVKRAQIWTAIQSAGQRLSVPIYAASWVPSTSQQKRKKLYAFDMDSTFINQEVIDELGRELGLYNAFATITERAMQGEMDFVQAFQERTALLRGLKMDQAQSITTRLTLSPGIETLLKRAKLDRAHTMIVSGGFDFVLRFFQLQLGIDEIHAHHLIQDETGTLTGEVRLPIVDAQYKKTLVHSRRESLGLTAAEVVVVGDGANDIQMMNEAETQVSFQGKEKLNQAANTWILHRDYRWLDSLLELLSRA
jgi:phosphoserine phosphatase SerB